MRHFVVTSTAFSGHIEYKFCDEGYLVEFIYQATMTAKQRDYALTKMPLTIQGFEELKGNSTTIKVEEVLQDLSFDAFWELYNNKINKKRCVPLYDKLNIEKRRLCIQSIPNYMVYLKKTNFRNQADPETYLRKEMYLNNWQKL